MAVNRKPWSMTSGPNSEICAEKRKKPLKSSDLRPDCWSNDALNPHWRDRNLSGHVTTSQAHRSCHLRRPTNRPQSSARSAPGDEERAA